MIDSHCHLTDAKFNNEVDKIVSNFQDAGVETVLNVSTNFKDSVLSNAISKKFENVYYAIGIHPEDVDDFDETAFEDCLRYLLKFDKKTPAIREFEQKYGSFSAVFDKNNKNKLIAVGEIGLDYFWRKDNREKQIEVFEKQVKLAKKYGLPFIVHNRDASGDVLEILKRNAPYSSGGIIHCFSASFEWAQEVLKLGFYISFSGSVTFKNSKKLQEVARLIPINKLLVETDSPYLTPEPYRGQRNEPKFVTETARFLATLRGLNCEEFNLIIKNNFKNLFKI